MEILPINTSDSKFDLSLIIEKKMEIILLLVNLEMNFVIVKS